MGLFNRLQDELDSRERQEGISPSDLLDLPPALASVIKKIVRHNGMKLTQIAEELGQTPPEARKMLAELVEKGYVRTVEVKNELWYKAQFARKRGRLTSDFWSNLDNVVDEDKE
ncbi:MAG: helix-turn-helix domain-containing protein [Anaerolineae bacterium]|nr:helix-turn-helix domain-containing protein [Anaerolineae bacterium]